MSDVLTIDTATSLAEIIGAAVRGAKVGLLLESGDILKGIARSIGDEQGYFLRGGQDVREAFLRITSISGFEHFIPVMDLVEKHKINEFVVDYDF